MSTNFKDLTEEEKIQHLTKQEEQMKELISSVQLMKEQLNTITGQKKTGTLIKFKNIVANSLVSFTNKYSFNTSSGAKKDWYSLGHKLGISINKKFKFSEQYYAQVIKSFEKISSKSNVLLVRGENKIDAMKETIFLVGNKKIIKKLHKNFSTTLNLMGFEANDFHHDVKKENLINEQEVQERVNKELSNLEFIYKEGEYTNDFFNNMDDESKVRVISKILWPQIVEKMNKSMEITELITRLVKYNIYANMIESFAHKNNLETNDVMSILKVDPHAAEKGHILGDKKGANKLVKNKEQIFNNINKLSTLTTNSVKVMSLLINVTESLKGIIENTSLSNKNELLEEINKTVLFVDKNKMPFYYEEVLKNVNGINKEIESKKIKP